MSADNNEIEQRIVKIESIYDQVEENIQIYLFNSSNINLANFFPTI